MKPTEIPQSFIKNGHSYDLVGSDPLPEGPTSVPRVAIYRQTHPERGTVAFETLKVRKRDKRVLNGTVFPESWRFPSNEEFGKYGWSYPTFDAAMKKYDEILKEENA